MDEKALFQRLENMGGTLEAILVEIKKPRHILLRVLDIAATGVGVLGITSIAEQVIKWVSGVGGSFGAVRLTSPLKAA